MQRFVGTLGWGMAFLALASCSSGSATPGGTGGKAGTGGAGTGGAMQSGSGGSGTGGSGTGGSGTGGSGTGGSNTGGSGTGGSNTGGSSSGGMVGTGGSATGGMIGVGGGAGGRAGNTGVAGGAGGDGEWTPLFNGTDLTGWTVGPSGAGLFAVDTMAGESAIHVYPTQMDQSASPDQATLRTNASYSSYVFHAEYKWGFKRFAGRAKNARDNGICWHIVLPLPNNDQWPTSIELQVGSDTWPADWVTGHIFMLVNKTRAQWPYAAMMGQNEVYSPTSTTKKSIGAPASYVKALSIPPNQNKGGLVSATAPATEWNVVELTVHGSKDASYNVNGMVVNGMTNMEYDTGNGTFAPLDHGPIALQAEFAEVYWRNVKIKILPAN